MYRMRLELSGRLLILMSFTSLVLDSCINSDASYRTDNSELILKINAVQEQVMAQGNMTKEEEQAMLSLCSIMAEDNGLANFDPNDRMILKDVDLAPVFKGCEHLTKEATTECFKDKIETFVGREFNKRLSEDLKLPKPKQVEAFFIIDESGNPTGMKVRNAELSIQAEILRVLSKIPVMKPAIYNGKSVAVLCSMLVSYGDEIEIDVTYIPELPDN